MALVYQLQVSALYNHTLLLCHRYSYSSTNYTNLYSYFDYFTAGVTIMLLFAITFTILLPVIIHFTTITNTTVLVIATTTNTTNGKISPGELPVRSLVGARPGPQ